MHDEQVEQAARDIVIVCRQLYAQGMLAACDGNVSMRIGPDCLVVTPSGVHKGYLEPEQLALVNLKGEVLEGKPTSELSMHLAVYQQCPKAKAVVHAHPPIATAWTIAFPHLHELPSESLSEIIIAVGKVPVVPYRRPGSRELGEALSSYVSGSKVCLLAHHGCLCWGTSLKEAFWGVERLEHAAKTLYHAQMLGGITPLPTAEIEALQELRAQLGDRVL